MTPQKQFKINRVILGLTQEELGELLGICRTLVGHYETGSRPIPAEVQKRISYLVDTYLVDKGD